MLKNYESKSPIPNIFADIKKTLSSHGATQIVEDYKDGRIMALSFVVPTTRGNLKIRLPAKYQKVEKIFQEQGIRYKPDQPYRTAWATIRDWVSAQMALLDWEMAKLEEIFLPYAVDKSGKTYFEVIEQRNFQLESGIEKGEVVA